MTDDQIINDLKNTYGTEFTAADVRGYCASHGVSYPTVTRRLEEYKVGRGKWNLEVTQETVKELEHTYQAPAVMPASEQNLIPQKMIPSSALVISVTLRKLLSPVSFTLRLSRVCRAMVKRLQSNKRAPNSDVNSSESTSR